MDSRLVTVRCTELNGMKTDSTLFGVHIITCSCTALQTKPKIIQAEEENYSTTKSSEFLSKMVLFMIWLHS